MSSGATNVDQTLAYRSAVHRAIVAPLLLMLISLPFLIFGTEIRWVNWEPWLRLPVRLWLAHLLVGPAHHSGKAFAGAVARGHRLPCAPTIPWSAIESVTAADHTFRFRRVEHTWTNVSVLWVSRTFYDRHIFINSWLLRGPGWDCNFIFNETQVGVVIQHEQFGVEAEMLRAEIVNRWQAFRGPSRVAGRGSAVAYCRCRRRAVAYRRQPGGAAACGDRADLAGVPKPKRASVPLIRRSSSNWIARHRLEGQWSTVLTVLVVMLLAMVYAFSHWIVPSIREEEARQVQQADQRHREEIARRVRQTEELWQRRLKEADAAREQMGKWMDSLSSGAASQQDADARK